MVQRLEHPYRTLTGGRGLRRNLRTHTTANDGERPMQVVLDSYAGRSCDFLAIIDHDLFSGPPAYASIEVRVPPEARYVRLECWGPGESFAWTEPFFVVEEDPAEGGAYVAQAERGDCPRCWRHPPARRPV
jgi:hypothetical protein